MICLHNEPKKSIKNAVEFVFLLLQKLAILLQHFLSDHQLLLYALLLQDLLLELIVYFSEIVNEVMEKSFELPLPCFVLASVVFAFLEHCCRFDLAFLSK